MRKKWEPKCQLPVACVPSWWNSSHKSSRRIATETIPSKLTSESWWLSTRWNEKALCHEVNQKTLITWHYNTLYIHLKGLSYGYFSDPCWNLNYFRPHSGTYQARSQFEVWLFSWIILTFWEIAATSTWMRFHQKRKEGLSGNQQYQPPSSIVPACFIYTPEMFGAFYSMIPIFSFLESLFGNFIMVHPPSKNLLTKSGHFPKRSNQATIGLRVQRRSEVILINHPLLLTVSLLEHARQASTTTKKRWK